MANALWEQPVTENPAFDARVAATLDSLSPAAFAFRDPWWIIGSTAMRLSGVQGIEPHDLDLLTSARDAESLIQSLSHQVDRDHLPADRRFDSRFASFPSLPMPVEVMGDLRMQVDGVWRTIAIQFSRKLRIGAHDVQIPTLPEQLRLLELFGRDKDRRKAALISSFLQETADVR